MSKKRIRRLILLAALVTLFLALGCVVHAEETTGTLTDEISYTLDDSGNLTIQGTGGIPDYDRYLWQENPSPFYEKTEVKTVTIGEGITHIGKFFCFSCENLKTVRFPAGLKSIGEGAFNNCGSLESVSFSAGLEEIGANAFSDCKMISSVTLPNSLRLIGSGAFVACSLKQIIIPDSVRELGEYAFADCAMLKTARLPGGLKEIPEDLFHQCDKLKTVLIPDGVEIIGGGAFYACSDLKELTLPAGLKKIGGSAFFSCASLETVTFQGNAPEFESYVFMLTNVTAYYPKRNATWTADIIDSGYGGRVKWVGVCTHAAGTAVTENRKEATVFAAGSYDSVVRCKYCRQEMSRKKVLLERLEPTIKLSAAKKKLKKGKSYKLTVSSLAKGDAVAGFKSSKKSVASVNKKGKIKAKKKGKAVITVTLKSGKTATCKITVK